jgi:hypothetical protein
LRIQDFKTIGTWRWQGCQPYAQAAFTPRKYSWYSFLSSLQNRFQIFVHGGNLYTNDQVFTKPPVSVVNILYYVS